MVFAAGAARKAGPSSGSSRRPRRSVRRCASRTSAQRRLTSAKRSPVSNLVCGASSAGRARARRSMPRCCSTGVRQAPLDASGVGLLFFDDGCPAGLLLRLLRLLGGDLLGGAGLGLFVGGLPPRLPGAPPPIERGPAAL